MSQYSISDINKDISPKERFLYLFAENKQDERKIIAFKLHQIIKLDNQNYEVIEITVGKNIFARLRKVKEPQQ